VPVRLSGGLTDRHLFNADPDLRKEMKAGKLFGIHLLWKLQLWKISPMVSVGEAKKLRRGQNRRRSPEEPGDKKHLKRA
jgi:hypothetical protein